MKALKILDLFGQKPELKIDGNSRLITKFGAFIGFITITVLTTGISIILNDYFSFLSYNFNSYIDNSARPDIDLSKIKLGFHLIDGLGNQFKDRDRLYSIKATFWDIYIPTLGSNETQKVEISDIPIIKFNQYKNNDLFKEEAELYTKIYNADYLDFESINKNLSGIFTNFGR